MVQGSGEVQGYRDCSNCQTPLPTTMDGGEKNLLFLDALKSSISEHILPADLERDKNCLLYDLSYYIYFRTFELRRGNHDAQ